MSNLTAALVGKYVHFARLDDDGHQLLHQGRIIGARDDLLLVAFSLTADGGPPVQGLMSLTELHEAHALIYESAEEAHDGLDRFEEYVND